MLAAGEVMRICRLLRHVIMIVPFWFLLFLPTVTTGLLWTQVTIQMLLTGVLDLL
jgi:hypothetical protein